jgi:hypothetical protein
MVGTVPHVPGMSDAQIPLPWLELRAQVRVDSPELCAKSVTAAGNTRSADGGGYCGYYVSCRVTCLQGAFPESRAYVYHGFRDTAKIGGSARTPADKSYCV